MEELTQFVTKSFEDKLREKCFDKKDVSLTDEKNENQTQTSVSHVDVSKCEESATDLSINVEVDVCSSQPPTPQAERQTDRFEIGMLENCQTDSARN